MEENRNCRQCGTEPGEVHLGVDDLTRCVISGVQLYMCDPFEAHEGECWPDVWDGEYPGVKECREYGMYTPEWSFWGRTEDLNSLAVMSDWNPKTQKYVMTSEKLDDYFKNYDTIFENTVS